MPYEPQTIVESPNLRRPVALIVDDPAPCINPLWYFRHQVDKLEEPAHERTIPLDFMRSWCDWIQNAGIRGDFTVLPFPAGLGRIDVGMDGYDREEVRAWVDLARRYVLPQFDIHCELLTHTNALDLPTGTMLPISEHAWTDRQDEATLTNYFAAAMGILKDAGLPNHGLTQPCTYKGDESMYARAILAAEKRINGRRVTHNFLHVDSLAPTVPPRITHLDPDNGEAVVSVWAATDDYIWGTQERGHADADLTPERLADRYITEDGTTGRLAELMQGNGPLVLVTHWQSLYSNGSQVGLRTYQEVMRRVQALWSQQIVWCKLSELSERFLAARTARFASTATWDNVRSVVTCPFAADVLTFSIPVPWPLEKRPMVHLDGRPLKAVERAEDVQAGTWLVRGTVVTISMSLARNVPREIVITRDSGAGLST